MPAPTTTRRALARATATGLAGVTAAGLLAAVPTAASAANPADLRPYYSVFSRGGAKIPGHDTPWTPQGLAYWAEQDALVVSYYDASGKRNSRLAIVDRNTGKRKKLLVLNTKGHVGGLAASKRHLWVANNGKVVRYPKSRLAATGNLKTVKATGSYRVAASSYLTYSGGSLWVGSFHEKQGGTAYRYDLSKKDVPTSGARAVMATPSQVQGMAIVGSKVVWSRSFGRNNRSKLDVRPRSAPTTGAGRRIVAPNMSEGIVVAKGELRVLYESSSSKYANASYRVRTIHRAPVGRVTG